jgi:hypothetical protein
MRDGESTFVGVSSARANDGTLFDQVDHIELTSARGALSISLNNKVRTYKSTGTN